MSPLKYLVIDDEDANHQLIDGFCSKMKCFESVGNCYSAIEAIPLVQGNELDVIFLDMEMPMLSGFEFLNTLSNPPHIIIVSAHKEFVVESYEYTITDYLLKPFGFERFTKAVQKIIHYQGKKNRKSDFVYIKDEKKHHKVKLDELIYIEAYGNYTKVHLSNRRILSQMKISDFEKLLPESEFFRIHRSYIINESAITLISSSKITLSDIELPIGRVYKEKVTAKLGVVDD